MDLPVFGLIVGALAVVIVALVPGAWAVCAARFAVREVGELVGYIDQRTDFLRDYVDGAVDEMDKRIKAQDTAKGQNDLLALLNNAKAVGEALGPMFREMGKAAADMAPSQDLASYLASRPRKPPRSVFDAEIDARSREAFAEDLQALGLDS